MPFFDPADRPTLPLFSGVVLTPIWGESIMMSIVRFERADAAVPEHSHPHEQMGMGLEGAFELTIGGESRVIRSGDAYWIPSGVAHGARSVDGPARALDIFHPVREEYKIGG